MTRRACQDNPLFEVSDMEIAAKGLSYTVKTLEVFADKEDCEPFFIMGTDSLREIRTWKDYERLFALAHFIVVTRPGTNFRDAWAELPAGTRAQFQDFGEYLIHTAGNPRSARCRGRVGHILHAHTEPGSRRKKREVPGDGTCAFVYY